MSFLLTRFLNPATSWLEPPNPPPPSSTQPVPFLSSQPAAPHPQRGCRRPCAQSLAQAALRHDVLLRLEPWHVVAVVWAAARLRARPPGLLEALRDPPGGGGGRRARPTVGWGLAVQGSRSNGAPCQCPASAFAAAFPPTELVEIPPGNLPRSSEFNGL